MRRWIYAAYAGMIAAFIGAVMDNPIIFAAGMATFIITALRIRKG